MFDMTDLYPAAAADLAKAQAIRPAAELAACAASMAARLRGYAGPDRRGPAGQQQRRMSQMLDTLDHGMLLVSDTIRVRHVNGAAWRDLDDQHPLQLISAGPDDLQLQARFGPDVVPLREALVGAAQRGLRRLLQLGTGHQRISVAVVPLPAGGAADTPCAAVLLGRRQVCEELTVDWFARSHRLTAAETTVMKGLCADFTPQQIANRQGVGLATVRTQIGSIRLKTGACSIRALVRQVALLPPLVSALLGVPRASDRVLQA